MKKYLGIIIILAVFIASIYLILKIPKPAELDIPVHTINGELENNEEWLGIFLQGQRIGYSFTTVTKTDTGVFVENRSRMSLIMMNAQRTVDTHIYSYTDLDFVLKEFKLLLKTMGHDSKIEGVIKGDKLTLTVYSQGQSQTQTIVLKEKPYLPSAIEEVIKQKNMKPGDEIMLPYFDPTTQSSTQAEIKVIGQEKVMVFNREYQGLRVEIDVMGLKEVAWFDDDFKLIKRSSPSMGMEMIPLSKEEALADIKPADAFDLLSFFSVKPDKPLADPVALSYLKLELKDITITDLDIDDDYQKLISKDPIIIEFHWPDMNDLPELSIPIKGHDEFLAPSLYIQCENREIIEKAKELSGSEKNAKKVVARLVTGVYDMLVRNPTASLPSAIDVLKTKEGDCNEHAVLFAALARAQGIPTKIYVGLVSLRGSAYFYHAWCAVWLGKWVPVDPTFNQFPADVGHLKLKEGEVSEWAKVLKVVGKLQINILDSRLK
jgi:transglutaminase-like putative cysteine protease